MLEVDHIVPRCEGGTDAPENLTTSCVPCNRGKSGIPLENVAPAVDEETALSGMQEMLERANAIKASTVVAEATRRAMGDAVVTIAGWWYDAFGDSDTIEANQASIRRFLVELNMDQIALAIEATERAAANRGYWSRWKAFKYFCGVCWSMIRQQREGDHA